MLFHAIAAAATAAAVGLVWRRRTVGTLFASGSVLGLVLGGVTFATGSSRFDLLRLLAWAIFAYGAAFLAGAAIALRGAHRTTAVLCAASLVLTEALCVYAFKVEPFRLEVTHHVFLTEKVEKPLRVALLADFQTDELGDYEHEVLRRLSDLEADVVLFAGDYVQERDPVRRGALQDRLATMLSSLPFDNADALLAVQGNVDPDDWPHVFAGTRITPTTRTESRDIGDIRITTLSVEDSFDPSLRVAPSDRFHIVVGHAPDFALADPAADLLLAGHTHGGQVRLPGIGPLMTLSKVPRSWAAGVTDVGRGTLYVSRGTGMERGDAPRLRFLCRPELLMIDIRPA